MSEPTLTILVALGTFVVTSAGHVLLARHYLRLGWQLCRDISEAEFQHRVMDAARMAGWLCCHYRPGLTRSGRWATPLQGDKGAPDLILAKDGHVLLAELKRDGGKPTAEQQAWLAAAGGHGRLWTPANWEAVLIDLGITERSPRSREDVQDVTEDARDRYEETHDEH